MSKRVHFSEAPDLVRQISDKSVERRQNSQTPVEQRLASNSFYMEEKVKINTDKNTKEKYENLKKYKKTPVSRRVSDAISKGAKESSQLRNEKIAQEHRYDHWWLGGKKITIKTARRKSIQRKSRKSRKNR